MTDPDPQALTPVLIVSGTGTEVGKTVVTAAIAALAADRGIGVAVVKPAQTGEPPGPTGDLPQGRAAGAASCSRPCGPIPPFLVACVAP